MISSVAAKLLVSLHIVGLFSFCLSSSPSLRAGTMRDIFVGGYSRYIWILDSLHDSWYFEHDNIH